MKKSLVGLLLVLYAALGNASSLAGGFSGNFSFTSNAYAQEIPGGLIAMWSGSVASVPTGWTICDGNNGTPDLRDKFIVGARQDDGGIAKTNVTGALTQTGGSGTHGHTAHVVTQPTAHAALSHTGSAVGDHTGLTHDGSVAIDNHVAHTHSVTSNVVVDNHAAHTHTTPDHSHSLSTHTHQGAAHTHDIAHTHGTSSKIGTSTASIKDAALGTTASGARSASTSGGPSTDSTNTSGNSTSGNPNATLTHTPTNNAVTSGNPSATQTHTANYTAPSAHGTAGTVTHSVTQPGDHASSSHVGTAVDAHSTESHLGPYYALVFIMKL